MVNFKGDKNGWSGCKFYPDCDTCGVKGGFQICIMEEGRWTPDDLEKAIKILKDYLGKQVNRKMEE